MKYLTIKEYAEKYLIKEYTVRQWTKSENVIDAPIQFVFSGKKALILDKPPNNEFNNDNKVSEKEAEYTIALEEIKKTQNMIINMCKHFGVDLNNLTEEIRSCN